MQENEDIVREYRERGLLVEVDTGKRTEESWEKLYDGLEKDIKWTEYYWREGSGSGGEQPANGDLIGHHVVAALGTAR